MRKPIPLQQPWYDEEEQTAAKEALRLGTGVGGGPVCQRVEAELRRKVGIRHAMLTPSATHALEMAILALGLGAGDEVILPSFTFASCANAVALRGATPVFADIADETMCLDPDDVRRRITSRTRALMPMHYGGGSAPMEPLMALAREHGLKVIEDAAHSFDASYRGRRLGTMGDAGCYSFHATKNLSCGEGGVFLTDNDEIAERAEIIREKGTNRSSFLRGEVDRYTWVATGSSYVLSDILAAVLEAQLRKADRILELRRELWHVYNEALAPLAGHGQIRLQRLVQGCESNYHTFYFHTASLEDRMRLLETLRAQQIGATFHYVPLHTAPEGRRFGGARTSLPVTERMSETLVRLPLYPQLPVADCRAIAGATAAFFRAAR